ncbi:MAG: cache domain-containing protein [Holophaga sp.]|nr:cache domain-containing protein [Holophaga sp.]
MRNFLAIPVLVALALPAFAQATRDDAKALVTQAVDFLAQNGREKLVSEVASPKGRFHFQAGTKKDLYIFVYDEKGTVVAHGVRLELMGKNRWESKDPDGKPWVQDWTRLVQQKGSGWIVYKELNPAAGNKVMTKASFVQLKDHLIIGCGIYQ